MPACNLISVNLAMRNVPQQDDENISCDLMVALGCSCNGHDEICKDIRYFNMWIRLSLLLSLTPCYICEQQIRFFFFWTNYINTFGDHHTKPIKNGNDFTRIKQYFQVPSVFHKYIIRTSIFIISVLVPLWACDDSFCDVIVLAWCWSYQRRLGHGWLITSSKMACNYSSIP